MCHTIIHGLYMEYHDSRDKMPLVTVAMAVYNADEFLEQAVNNILAQTFRDYELLLIDDGSTDQSKSICVRLAASDSRIRCIFKDRNDGLAVVRNMSIDEAVGKYLMMVDADDVMDPRTIELAVTEAEKSCADVVIWDYDTFSGPKPNHSDKDSRLTGIDTSDRHNLLRLPAFMPVRLMRTEYIKSRGLKFPKGLTKQDIPIHWATMTDADCRIAIIPQKLFHYRQQPNATSCRKGRSLFSLAQVMDIVRAQLKTDNLYEEYRTDYMRNRLSLLHGMHDFIKPELKNEALQMIRERLDDDAVAFLKEHPDLLSRRVRLFYKMIQGNISAMIQYKSLLTLRTIYRKLK